MIIHDLGPMFWILVLVACAIGVQLARFFYKTR